MAAESRANETSLADLVQANALGGNTCRVVVTTPQGRGVFYMEEGEIVDAAYGDLAGEDAFYALVNAPEARSVISSGLRTGARRIQEGWETLLLHAMTLRFEGRLPVPRFGDGLPAMTTTGTLHAPERPGHAPTAKEPAARPEPVPPAASTPPTAQREEARAERKATPSPLRTTSPQPGGPAQRAPATGGTPRFGLAIGIGLAVLAAAGYAVLGRHAGDSAPSPLAAPAASSSRIAPVESTDLTAPGDAVPELAIGPAPRSPDPDSAVSPTIVCRILVDEQGRVKEAQVFRSRLDLAAFEDAALVAVRAFTFKPGRRAGRPVPVWINWPVSFQ